MLDPVQMKGIYGNILFNDALNTFYLRLYGARAFMSPFMLSHAIQDQQNIETN